MKSNLAQWGNRLHSGEKIYPIVPQRKRWFIASGILLAASIVILLIRGLNPGIDFSGGTEFRVTNAPNPSTEIAAEVITEAAGEQTPRVTLIGDNDVRIQIGVLETDVARQVSGELADAYEVPADQVSFTQIGPTWGASVGQAAIQGLIIFLVLVAVV